MRRWDDHGSMDELGDAALVDLIVAGDERALMYVYDRYGDSLFAVAVRFLADREAAAEVVQETFLSLWQRAARYDVKAGTLVAWLIGIVRHRALDRLRSESRRPRIVARFDVGPDAAGGMPDAEAVLRRNAVHVDEPAAEVDRRWARSVVRSALSEMPEVERRVLVLAYDEGLSQSEIAARLGWPIGTVKSRTRRALAGLREKLVAIPELAEA